MPRIARIKSEDSIYHIMMRSISEIDLFKETEDKIKYFSIIRKCQLKYGFAVYAYCLMDNHGHLIIDCLGADISRIMHSINLAYAIYYNRKYKRHGHVFQDRFKSKIIDKREYIITLSAYIHNNPKDIPAYSNNVIKYPFSSLKEYLNRTNTYEILNQSFLGNILGLGNKQNRTMYIELIKKSDDKEEMLEVEFVNTEAEYRSERNILLRYHNPTDIIQYLSQYLNIDYHKVHVKYRKAYTELRALSCFFMSCFCNISQREICNIIGNITQARVSSLSDKGLEIAFQKNDILPQFMV